jgi:hypothetical protein
VVLKTNFVASERSHLLDRNQLAADDRARGIDKLPVAFSLGSLSPPENVCSMLIHNVDTFLPELTASHHTFEEKKGKHSCTIQALSLPSIQLSGK